MGLSWQQGPLSGASVGRFLTPEPLSERLLFVEPLRRRLRVKLAGEWIADSEDVLLFHEPGRYPVAYFPLGDVRPGVLVSENRLTQHSDLGDTDWFTAKVGDRRVVHAAWRYTSLPGYAGALRDRVAFAWRAMDAFYEEDERIVGHAAAAYHRIDIRQSSRHLVIKDGVRPIADTRRRVVLYESGFAPRWYVPREDIDESALVPADGQTFCPTRGWQANTTSVTTNGRPGTTRRRGPRSHASPTSSPSSRTRSRSSSSTRNSPSSQVRASRRTESTEAWTPTRYSSEAPAPPAPSAHCLATASGATPLRCR
jgi:uncharacterized protein (DUF427 family)